MHPCKAALLESIKNKLLSFQEFLTASSNMLNNETSKSWEQEKQNDTLAGTYLTSVEALIKKTDITNVPNQTYIEVSTKACVNGSDCSNKVFNNTISLANLNLDVVKTAAFRELGNYLPEKDNQTINSMIVSATTKDVPANVEVKIDFELLKPRPPNTKITCVAWDNNTKSWAESGCKWKGPNNEKQCVCKHLSSFALLMSKEPISIPGITVVTYIGLSISVVSLILSLAAEMTVWRAVVKTNTLYVRHTAHVNIALCLLVADCCFLGSSKPKTEAGWCKASAVIKHFCYLAMFFWMLCLSCTLLHQTVFPFHTTSKKSYLRFSMVLGYVCPMIIVAATILANDGGAEGKYFRNDTCWLVYEKSLKGSIFSFIIPIGIIFFINIFSMVVVIIKLLDHPKSVEMSRDKEKKAALTVIRSVVLLTPVFGLTWIFGFAVLLTDTTQGPIAFAVNYIFTVVNSLQVQ